MTAERPFPEKCEAGHRVFRETCKPCCEREELRWAATGYAEEELADRVRRIESIVIKGKPLTAKKVNYRRGPK